VSLSESNDWTMPQALAILKEGYFKLEEGKYGPVSPRTPACHGDHCQNHAGQRVGGPRIQKDARKDPGDRSLCPGATQTSLSAMSAIRHRQRCVLMYQGIFDTDFDKYTDDAVALFTKSGISTTFENLEGFPEDWRTNVPVFIKFVREYPYVTADETKKALRLKNDFSEILDQM